jgi:hypothetical protein
MADPIDVTLKEYSEVVQQFRTLTDIRFKLIGFLPAVTALSAIVGAQAWRQAGAITFALSLFGLVVVLGLINYSVRNDQLYDELVGRAASLERSLRIRDGSFAFRPHPWFHIGWTIDHGNALALIYGASAGIWLTGVLAPLLEFFRWAYVEQLKRPAVFLVKDIQSWEIGTAAVMAMSIVILTQRRAEMARESQRRKMRAAGIEAMRLLKGVLGGSAGPKDFDIFIAEVLLLASKHRCSEEERVKRIAALKSRYAFYTNPENAERFLPGVSERDFPAYLIGAMCDLPPRWIADWDSGRRA